MDLFETSFHEVKDRKEQAVENEASDLSKQELEASTDTLALILAEKHAIEKVTLYDEERERAGEVKKDVSDRRQFFVTDRSSPTYKTAQRVRVKIPYEGDREALQILPTTHRMTSRPSADEITRGHIIFNVDFFPEVDDSETVESEIEERVENINRHVRWLNSDLEDLQEGLERTARTKVEERREVVESREEILEEIGVDESQPESGFIRPEKKREIELEDLGTQEGDSTSVLHDSSFTELLGVIDDVGLGIERASSSVRGLDEESLRDILLTAINSHYSGLATGESFNRQGKTDILLRNDNANLFIAECKFWRGQSVYSEAIDQLLDYLTVRDTHAAVIIFSNNEDFQEVAEKMETATASHDEYMTKLTQFSNHDIYKFGQESGVPVKLSTKLYDTSV